MPTRTVRKTDVDQKLKYEPVQRDYRQGWVTNGPLSARDRNDQRQAGADLRAAHKEVGTGGV